MNLTDLLDDERVRLRIAIVAMLLCLLGLIRAFWNIQVVRQPEFRSREELQSIRRVRLPGPRGRIWDRNGVLLAGNRPSYGVAVYLEELRQPRHVSNTINRVDEVLDELSERLGIARTVTRNDIAIHMERRRPMPLLAWRDIDARTMARLVEHSDPLPGVDLFAEPERYYPDTSLARHVLGYVGRREVLAGDTAAFHLPEMEGKSGVESALNASLTGTPGGRLLQVDASGFKRNVQAAVDPQPGTDVVLTLDARIQALVEAQLRGERGACVVVDPRNGDVLALASSPGYVADDLQDTAAYGALLTAGEHPLINRAIASGYPPGSTFKPLVAIAALENGRATPDTEFNCPGYFAIGSHTIGCWRTSGHGTLRMRKALEQSCNTYFCALGLQCGYERIYHMAAALGFGFRSGIELPGEVSGLLPDDTWKRRRHHDGWRSGDTCNISIGQGFLLVTPLQMAAFTATVANGGILYRPRLVAARREGEPVNDMRWSPATLNVVRGGMTDVVNATSGTGKRARLPDVRVAGKTGSAEYGPRLHRRKYAWMTAFAPAESPRYALAIVIEDGISGGLTTAPRVHDMLASIFEMEGLPAHREDST